MELTFSAPLIARPSILPFMALMLVIALCNAIGCQSTSTGSSSTSPSPHSSASNLAIVQAAFDRWRAQSGGPFELLAEDAQWTIVGSSPLSRTYVSKQDFIDTVITPFNARVVRPLSPTIRKMHADGNAVIILFDGETEATDGRPYRNTYAWFFDMKDGKVINATAFFDTRIFDDLWTRVLPS